MRRKLLPLALCLVPLLVAPVASGAEAVARDACFIFLAPSADFSTIRVRADLAYTEEEKREIARAWDANGDGSLSLTETHNFTASTARVITDPAQMGELRMYIDQTLPRSVTVMRSPSAPLISVENVDGWNIAEIRVYDFDVLPVAGDARILSGGVYARPLSLPPQPVIEALVVTAPDGWVVWSLGEIPGAQQGQPPPTMGYVSQASGTHYGERQAHAGQLDVNKSYFVVFSREGVDPFAIRGGGGIPLPGAALALLALAAPLLLRLRGARTEEHATTYLAGGARSEGMPRNRRESTENEKEHAYVMHNKREYGDKIQGDAAEFLDEKGGHGEVKQRREAWGRTSDAQQRETHAEEE